MQFDKVDSPSPPVRLRPARTRLIGINTGREDTPAPHRRTTVSDTDSDIAIQPTISFKQTGAVNKKSERVPLPNDMHQNRLAHQFDDDISSQSTMSFLQLSSQQSTMHLVKLSGMMPPRKDAPENAQNASDRFSMGNEDGYWPYGIQQTGPLPVLNLYGREPFGRTLPLSGVLTAVVRPEGKKKQSIWKALLNTPAARVAIGLLIGVGLLLLVARFVDLPATIRVLRVNLETPQGVLLALLAGMAFLTAWSIRGIRWKLFLNSVGKVSTFQAIALYQVGVFLNFLLPIRGGEVAKCFMLKHNADIPVSKSLPTVAMDKALDLMPALFIITIVPFLGVQMDIKLWLVLWFVSGILISLLVFILLSAWKHDSAIALLKKMTRLFPKSIASKVEGFATGFVDSLLAGASQPRIFIPAIMLTIVAVLFDGLFAMLAFWTIGFHITFGMALFGYSVYNMFYILPTPPGQVGSNEFVGLLVFGGLLHIPAYQVTAMFVFSHPWAAVIMCTTGLICLSALGLTITGAMKVQKDEALRPSKDMGAPAKA
jgi:uncharacterized protein (TIRG00374 family)